MNFPMRTAPTAKIRPAPLLAVFTLAIVSASGATAHVGTFNAPPPPRPPEPTRRPMEPPDSSPAVLEAIAAPFLTPEEAKNLRVFHGTATPADLDTPARRTAWALTRGTYLDPAFDATDAPPLDRAEALLNRGDIAAALALIEQDGSMRAVRLRVTGYALLGRPEMAVASVEPALILIRAGTSDSAGDIAHAARAAAIVTRWRAEPGEPGAQHKAIMAALKRAREQVDRLHWPVMLAEAEILYEKDNSAQAQEALQQVLALNPACAEAWALLGRMATDAFDMNSVESIATRLELLAGSLTDPSAEALADAADAPAPAAPSPLAASIRIRAMLRQNDPDLAASLSDGARRAYPLNRDLLALEAAIEALRFDPAALEEKLKAFTQQSPGSAQALYEAGKALAEARQYAPAADLLRRAAGRQPYWSKPLTDLGLLFVQSGQDDEAGEALLAATALDPFNVRADNSLKLITEMRSYRRVESDHFIVRFKGVEAGGAGANAKDGGGGGGGGAADALLAREMLPVLEENFRRVTGNPDQTPGGLDFAPEGKTLIDLMPNHRWFAVRIAGMPKIHTIAAATGPIIAMEAPRDGPSHSGTYDWPRVLRHEYTHTVGLARTGNRLPHWFTEAQSVFLEQSPRDFATCQLLARTFEKDELFDFVAINQAFVRPRKPSDRQLAYAQGHWMYEFLVETFGARSPLTLMDLYAKGVREEEAYQRVLNISRDEFMARFKPWAEKQLIAWGMRPPAGMPTMKSLVEAAMAVAGGDSKDLPADKGEAEVAAAVPTGDKPATGEQPGQPDNPEAAEAPVAARQAEVTPAIMDRWLADHPNHPDVLELAVRRALSANANTPTLDMVPLLERYAAARPVDPLPHKTLARLYLALPAPATQPPGTEAAPSPRDAIPHLEWLDEREDRAATYADQLAALYATGSEGERDLHRAWLKAQRAVRIGPYEARLRERAAAIALLRQDFETAKYQIEAMIVLEPDRPVHRQRLEALNRRLER